MASAYMRKEDYTEYYNEYVTDSSKVSVFTSTTQEGNTIAFIGKIIGGNLDADIKKTFNSIDNKIYRTWQCNICRNRSKKYRYFIDTEGPVFCKAADSKDKYIEKCQSNLNSTFNYLRANDTYENLWTLIPVTKDYIDPKFEGEDEFTGEKFAHFHLTFDKLTDEEVDIDKYTKVFWRYVPLMKNLLSKLTPSLVRTLEEFIKILEVETYAKVLLPGTKWLHSICSSMPVENFNTMSVTEKMAFVGDIISKSNISEDDNAQYVITNYHQASNSVLTLLETGTSWGIEKMKQQLTKDFGNPHTYQRRTREATEKMAEIAMDKLGDFTNTIHTVAEIEAHPGTLTLKGVPKEQTSSLGAFKKMGKAPAPSSKYDFVSKLDKTKSRSWSNLTLGDIIEKVRSGEIHTLKIISTTSLKPCYTAKTDLDRSNIIYDFLWNFMNYEDCYSRYGSGGACAGGLLVGGLVITHIVPIKTSLHNNIIFVVKDSYKSQYKYPITGNCCFPEFLTTKCKRTAGTAFEELNSVLPISIPEDQPISLGVGTSIINESNELHSPIKFMINGSSKEITVTHL